MTSQQLLLTCWPDAAENHADPKAGNCRTAGSVCDLRSDLTRRDSTSVRKTEERESGGRAKKTCRSEREGRRLPVPVCAQPEQVLSEEHVRMAADLDGSRMLLALVTDGSYENASRPSASNDWSEPTAAAKLGLTFGWNRGHGLKRETGLNRENDCNGVEDQVAFVSKPIGCRTARMLPVACVCCRVGTSAWSGNVRPQVACTARTPQNVI